MRECTKENAFSLRPPSPSTPSLSLSPPLSLSLFLSFSLSISPYLSPSLSLSLSLSLFVPLSPSVFFSVRLSVGHEKHGHLD